MTNAQATLNSPGVEAFDVQRIRAQFPALHRTVHDKPLVWLDSAATSQKPQCVIDRMSDYYQMHNANVHRGVHQLSVEATEAFERARSSVRRFLNAAEDKEIIFTKGATEAINLVASAWGRANLKLGDEIILTQMEHHSNIVPWQLIAEQTGAIIRVLPVNEAGELEMDKLPGLLNERTKMVGVVYLSNALGTINPVKQIVELAHEAGALVIVDSAQATQHLRVDVRDLGCDFLACAGHKMFGPTGIGALYGRRELLEAMPPYQGGGDMILKVSFEGTTYNELPNKFEAGTPNVAGAVGLDAAIGFLDSIDYARLAAYEADLLAYTNERLREIPGLRIVGQAANKASVISFVIDGVHPHDLGTIADTHGVAIRTGHHCTQPLMDRLGLAATARASFAMYNTREDADALVDALKQAVQVFAS